MKDLQEQMTVITIIGHKNMNDELVGKKIVYQQDKNEATAIDWIDDKLRLLVQTSSHSGTFLVEEIVNPQDPDQAVTVMIEPIMQSEELVILGGGHIAQPLAKVAKLLGFKVTVADDRPGFASKERFPEADCLVPAAYEDILNYLDLGPRSHVVVVTQGHRHDWVCVQQVMKYPLAYLGVIGSRRKISMTREKLLGEGYAEEKIDRIYMPVGLDIGAETPEEIAVSIAAELIKVRYGGRAASLSGNNELIAKSPDLAIETQSDLIKNAMDLDDHGTPAAVATIIEAAGSTPRKAGSRMIVKKDGSILGTIGGGKGEALVCEEAIRIMERKIPGIYQVDMNADIQDELGMICGGSIKVFIEPVKMFAQAFKEGRPS